MNRYTRLNDEVELSNEHYLDDVQSQQQVLSGTHVLYLLSQVNPASI